MAVIADKYVLINEYFNPTPTEIVYRGHSAKLFKRDFAGEFLDSTEDSNLCAGDSCGSVWNPPGITATGLCCAAWHERLVPRFPT